MLVIRKNHLIRINYPFLFIVFYRYTGTPWFSVFKDNITAAFLDLLKPDAIVKLILLKKSVSN